MNPLTRRHFLTQAGLGATALSALMNDSSAATHFTAKAKRVIYLFQSGAPSQMDLFDPKPGLQARFDQDLPDSIRKGQRLTGMTATQERFPIAPSRYRFARHGKCGAWLSELLPHTAEVADELCFIKSMHTEAINHDPAITFFQTGAQLAGRPSIGSWLSYGLGSENSDLPAFVALLSNGSGNPMDQPLYDRLWGSGFLPTKHQGVKFRSQGDPVLFLSNPAGMNAPSRRRMLDDLARLNQMRLAELGDPEIATRIAQYEMAFQMQASVPELMDIRPEGPKTLELYGCTPGDGSFASNCLLARRLAERGTRFIQLYHRDWDHHSLLREELPLRAKEVDRACMALITDLKQRGLFNDTLIVFSGEFGRTPMAQGNKGPIGRDHHNKAMSMWLAGAGIQRGLTFGSTDDLGYAAQENITTVHDLHATMLHQLGIQHDAFSFKFQGLDAKLSGVEGAKVIKKILS